MLADPCADPGIFAKVVQVFFFVLNFYSFTVAFQWFISKKTIILHGFGGGGGGGGGFYSLGFSSNSFKI